MTQGDSLAMIVYGIGVLPIIREIRDARPRVTQPWYADDARGGGGGVIKAHPCTLPEPTGKGSTVGLISGTYQEYLCRGPAKRVKGGGIILWYGDQGGHRG